MSKLLLIDDEEDVRYSLQRILATEGIELATAASGEEGLKVIPKFKPDLVLMDVRMTGMTGLETLRQIRTTDPKLRTRHVAIRPSVVGVSGPFGKGSADAQ